MYQKDYILKLIEEAANALRKILSLENDGKYEEAIKVINESFTNLLGINIIEIEKTNADDLISFLVDNKDFGFDKLNITADLLIEIANCSIDFHKRQIVLLKAKQLLYYLNNNEKIYSFERINKIKLINDKLKEQNYEE